MAGFRKLIVEKKTGFKITDPSKPVIIRDNRGILFYSTETLINRPDKQNVDSFNLPGFGTYQVETGSFTAMATPIQYKYAPLPALIRRHPSPFDFKIVWGNNPYKCTVKWTDKIIFFDKQFEEKPLPQVFFILYHEFAHAFFEEETLCDQMAGNYMKAKGFNPSQIGSAPVLALSTRQYERKVNMVESILNSQ